MTDNECMDMQFDESLLLCIRQGDNEDAQAILQEMDPCKMVDSSGTTLLHVASDCGNEVMAKYLIEEECKIDAVDDLGNTPLILALRQGHKKVGQLLLEANASVLIANKMGESAANIVLGSEVFYRTLELLDKKIKEECLNDSLQTAKVLMEAHCSLARAVRLKDTVITKYMLDKGRDVNEKDLRGMNTALHEAVRCSDLENIKLLISYGADVHAKGWHYNTPLHHARNRQVLEFLLDQGARFLTDNGNLVNDYLFLTGDKDLVEMLISKYKPDFSAKGDYEFSLLHSLVRNTNFDPTEILKNNIDHSFDVNQKNIINETPLMYASFSNNYGLVEFLLEMGAEINFKDNHGRTALQRTAFPPIYRPNMKANIVTLLLQYGADVQCTKTNNQGNQSTIFDTAKLFNMFVTARIIIAHLAVMESVGSEIKEVILRKINSHEKFENYYNICKSVIKELKRTVIKEQITLFDFLTISEKSLMKFARDEEFFSRVQLMAFSYRRSKLYYHQMLRRRVKKAIQVRNLRENTFDAVDQIQGLQSNQLVIKKIVDYIINDDLKVLEKRPTFIYVA